MQFQVSHVFAVSRENYMRIYLDPDFERFIVDHSTLRTRTVIAESRDGMIIRRKLRICSGLELPAMLKKVAGFHDLCYTEEAVMNLETYETRWTILPDAFKDKITATGITVVHDRGADRCERSISGTIGVAIPFIGSMTESFIIESIKKTYRETAGLFEQYLLTKQA